MTTPYDSVMLIGFGGPPDPRDAYAFVKGVVGNRPASEERLREVAHHYEIVGGSPFNKLTSQQAVAIAETLAQRGLTLPVVVGFRHWTPTIAETLADLSSRGCRNTVGVIMAPHPCWSADDKYREAVEAARQSLAEAAPAVTYTEAFGAVYGYVAAQADLVRQTLARSGLSEDRAARAELVFTAHSVPVNGCELCRNKTRTCPYPTHYTQTCQLVAEALGRTAFTVAYQSRAEFRRPWLEPDINEALKSLAARGDVRDVVVAPVGFVCDHVEVLFDLDIEARQTAADLGLGYYRVATVQDHPAFVRHLAYAIEARVRTQMPV